MSPIQSKNINVVNYGDTYGNISFGKRSDNFFVSDDTDVSIVHSALDFGNAQDECNLITLITLLMSYLKKTRN